MNKQLDLSCVLFDLDGTLLNTALDLTTALNKALAHHHFPEVTANAITPYISYGTTAMIETALKQKASEAIKASILECLLNYYANHIADFTKLYAGMPELLAALEAANILWGVITNKRERMAQPLMSAMNLTQRSACIICGDTTAYRKPHPQPMLTACKQLQTTPEKCLYIGDAEHDIMAGKVANMKTLVATWGYLKPDDNPQDWGSDALMQHPKQILDWIRNQSHVFN